MIGGLYVETERGGERAEDGLVGGVEAGPMSVGVEADLLGVGWELDECDEVGRVRGGPLGVVGLLEV